MLSHDAIWSAIDRLAAARGLSASGLAKAAGLDPTAFNRSKRAGPDGRPRWPSTESLARVLAASGTTLDGFLEFLDDGGRSRKPATRIPLIGLARAGAGGYCAEGGLPTGEGWEAVEFPASSGAETFAIEVQGDSMLPLYRDGDILIVDPSTEPRKGDRVVVRTTGGEVLAKVLKRRNAAVVELHSVNPDHPDLTYPADAITWMARIVWASQ